MNIIYDIKNEKIRQTIQDTIHQNISHSHEISYQRLTEPVMIFKDINDKTDILELKEHAIPHHSLIFIINNGEFMFQLLEYYPLCYIRTTHFHHDLEKCIQLIKDIYNNKENIITLKINHSYVQIKISQIYYIESFGHYLIIYTHIGEYKVREKLINIFHKLNPFGFIQVHKSYIINKQYIETINTNDMIMINKACIPIGRKYKDALYK